jgi:ammonium transporter, Amt family
MMHALLIRQLKRHFGSLEAVPPDVQPFAAAVSEAYDQADADRRLVERSMDVVSAELLERNHQLALAEKTYRSIFENAVMGIFLTTPQGRFANANMALARMLGYDSPEELKECITDIGRQIYVEGQERGRFLQEMSDQGRTLRFETRMRRKDGSIIWVSMNALAVRDAAGRLLYNQGTIEDVTLHRQQEERERAKKAAEAACRAKSEFLASMSHEIRTPLNGVIGMLELLQGAGLNERQAQFAHLARSSAGVLLSLVNDILDFSKIEAGKLELDCTEFNLHQLVEGTAQMFGESAGKKRLELTCCVEAGVPPMVRADPTRLRQVLCNLLGNAVKFTEKGGVSLHVAVEEDQADAALVRVSVRDTGIGIPQDRLHRLFQSFSQVDASTTRKFGGTGLGLAISMRIVQLMGGEIHVESVPDKGSTFWFSVKLPKCRFQEAAATPVGSRDETPVAKGARILLVEDNEINQLVAQEILSQAGYECELANNGREAVEQVTTGDFDLVVMDCQMPVMDGFEATERIRRHESGRGGHVPIVALTANAVKGDRERCLAVGMDGYVTKPVESRELLSAIYALLPEGARTGGNRRTARTHGGTAVPDAEISRSAGSPQSLDIDSLLARCLGNVDLVRRMLDKFKTLSADTLAELTRHVESSNPSEAARISHSLKGAAANMSADGVAAIAAQIEMAGRANDLAAARQHLDALRREIDRCHAGIVVAARDLTTRQVVPVAPPVP